MLSLFINARKETKKGRENSDFVSFEAIEKITMDLYYLVFTCSVVRSLCEYLDCR